jgi:hypothetical protein
MVSSSSQNNLDLNAAPVVQPEIWRPLFLSQKGHLMTNDSVMLHDAVAASVAQGIITPRDEKLLADRTDVQAINDSLAFSIQGASSVTNMARCLQVRGNEIQALKAQILTLQRMYMGFRRRNRVLQQENKRLKIRMRKTWERGMLTWSRTPIASENNTRISCLQSKILEFSAPKLSQVFYLI